MSEVPGGFGAVSGVSETVVLARSDHTLRLVNALDHARQSLRAPPPGDFSATMGEKLAQTPADRGQAESETAPSSENDETDTPRLDFVRTSILRGHVSQPGPFNPDPTALPPLPDLPRERDAAQGPAPDTVRADEISALSAMLDAARPGPALPPVDGLAQAEANQLPVDVLQDMRDRHLAREAQSSAGNGWPAPSAPDGMNGTGNER